MMANKMNMKETEKTQFTEKDRINMKVMIYLYLIAGALLTPGGFFLIDITTKGTGERFFAYVILVIGIVSLIIGSVFEVLYIILFKRVEWA